MAETAAEKCSGDSGGVVQQWDAESENQIPAA